jgi:hypothetical protein
MTDFGRHGRASFAVTHNGALWKALSSTGNLQDGASPRHRGRSRRGRSSVTVGGRSLGDCAVNACCYVD